MRLNEYTKIQQPEGTDVFAIDGTDGTRCVQASDLFYALAEFAAPEAHRTIFRGKNLGNTFTAEQKAAIQNGTFNDLWLGDYWEISGKKYRIADINYFYSCGYPLWQTNHLIVVPDNVMYSGKMEETNITTNGYYGSAMRKTGLANALTTIHTAFGEANVLSHKEYLSNAATNGIEVGCEEYTVKVCLMSERMVYGHSIYGSPLNQNGVTDNLGDLYPYDKTQFALFAAQPKFITANNWYWLRDVVSSGCFAGVGRRGDAGCRDASGSGGVRPYFCVG